MWPGCVTEGEGGQSCLASVFTFQDMGWDSADQSWGHGGRVASCRCSALGPQSLAETTEPAGVRWVQHLVWSINLLAMKTRSFCIVPKEGPSPAFPHFPAPNTGSRPVGKAWPWSLGAQMPSVLSLWVGQALERARAWDSRKHQEHCVPGRPLTPHAWAGVTHTDTWM